MTEKLVLSFVNAMVKTLNGMYIHVCERVCVSILNTFLSLCSS